LVFYGTFSANRLYHATEVGNLITYGWGWGTTQISRNKTREYNKPTQS